MWRNKGFLYRFVALTLAFVVFGVAIIVPLLAGTTGDHLPALIALYIFLGLYAVTLIGNEVYIFLRKRREKK